MNKIKVTQVRSIIGRDETQKRTIQALGLGKINRSRVHNDTPAIRGMINKVRHLVMVEEIIPETVKKEEKQQAVKAEVTEKAAETKKPKVTKAVKETETPEEDKKPEKKTAKQEETAIEEDKEVVKQPPKKKTTEEETTETDSNKEE